MARFTGVVQTITFRNPQNGWTVAGFQPDGSGRISAVGIMPFLAVGERVALEGERTEHREYGEQIRVTSYESLPPETPGEVERYLASGLISGVGPSTARQLVNHFGPAVMDVLEAHPERLTEVPGIGKKRAAMIAESFAEQHGTRGTLMFLQARGLSPAMSMRVYQTYGDMTETVVRENPYRLVDEVEGIGFRTADDIARGLGFTAGSEFRLRSGVRYVLNEAVNSRGHLFLPEDRLIEASAKVLEAEEDVVANTVRELVISRGLMAEETPQGRAIYLSSAWHAERETAQMLIRQKRSARGLARPQEDWEDRIAEYEHLHAVSLSPEQREAVRAAVTEGVSVITGGPGTGKTTAINCILWLLGEDAAVALAAPTGRAARRMSEATGAAASTLHRLLEYQGEGRRFARDSENPLDAGTVVVDEMSMVDIYLMRALLDALRPGTRLVLVGDADQLPSVGAGDVLRDIIRSETVPVVRLTEIFRQARESMIVVNAHRINRGEMPEIRSHDTDFFLQRTDDAASTRETVVDLVRRRLPGFLGLSGENVARAIQVMAPMKRGDVGVYALNQRLQEALNPASPEKPEIARGDTRFRLGDKVMQMKNDYDAQWHDGASYGTGVFNGDLGQVVDVDQEETALTVRFDDGHVIDYDSAMLENLEIAYCMSVHKSQGSEFDVVVLPLLGGPQMLMTRNLLYTAVTRAKRMAVIVGRPSCIREMIGNDRVQQRFSLLKDRLQREDGGAR